MRKLIAAVLLTIATIVPAHAQHGHHHHGHGGGGNWVAPLVIGGIVGAVIANQNRPVYVTPPPPVIYYPGQVYPDYTYRPMYRMVDVYIPECGCTRSVQVQIN